jgi:hypothetical protein
MLHLLYVYHDVHCDNSLYEQHQTEVSKTLILENSQLGKKESQNHRKEKKNK